MRVVAMLREGVIEQKQMLAIASAEVAFEMIDELRIQIAKLEDKSAELRAKLEGQL